MYTNYEVIDKEEIAVNFDFSMVTVDDIIEYFKAWFDVAFFATFKSTLKDSLKKGFSIFGINVEYVGD